MISRISTTASSIINRLYFNNKLTKKITVPVRPFLSPSIALKHLIGIPSTDNMDSIPLYKLRMLDNLIERLTRLKAQGISKEFADRITAHNIDSYIKNLTDQVRNISLKLLPYTSGLSTEQGMLINVSV
jgi:hypothetical protein